MNAAAAKLQGGAYPLRVAARLAHMRPITVRRWIEGYRYTRDGEQKLSAGVPYLLTTPHATALDDAPEEGRREGRRQAPLLDFEQLLTLLLVRAFHQRGLSLPKIKAAAARAKEFYGLENPFVSRRFKSDGNRVFIDLDPSAQGRERELIDVLSDQRQFREVVEPSLFRDVVFVGDRAGEWWPLGRDRSVLLSPGKQFGAPHIAGTGVRTDVVADFVAAEGGGELGVEAAAEWFGLAPQQVEDAVEFEGEWLQRPLS